MRYVIDCNPNKRGCHFCADTKFLTDSSSGCKRKFCIHDECPYHKLDDVKNYMDYDKQLRKHGKKHLESWLKKVFSLSEK